jgi:DNA-binding NtrC family response regulator/tetratricopeptide (TPR) repeat protein
MVEGSDAAKPKHDALGDFVGDSPAIVAVRRHAERLAARQLLGRPFPPILILGERGTGKTSLARLIHSAGPRVGGPFVQLSCPNIQESLLESVLFGFERGAFTDAKEAKTGLFQAAHRGTIFLDEIGVISEQVQAKLLDVIQERAVRPIGSTRSVPVDVAIIAATNEDLNAAVGERRFRADLYDRLAVLTMELPSLRERGNDLLLLAERLLARACADYQLPRKTLDAGARAALRAYHWPGNVRELGNVLERVVLNHDETVVTAEMLDIQESRPALPASQPTVRPAAPREAPQDAEPERYWRALESEGWNRSRAAKRLGITRNTLRYRIEAWGLKPGAPPPSGRRLPAPPTAPVPTPIASKPHAAVPAPPPPAPEQGQTVGVPGPSAPARLRWDTRRLTFLRAALIPTSTEDATAHASRLAETLVEKVQSFGGRVEELGPTGIVASFGLEWREDAARHAAHAAMAMQRAVGHARRDGLAPRLKAGIHVGQFLIGEGGAVPQIDFMSKREALHLLDSLLAGGDADTVLATESAAPFLERSFDLEPVALAGSTGTVLRLGGRPRSTPSFGRPMAPFVGRQHDLELLESRLATTLGGRGQVVGIVGDAGLGKSRLVFEFHRALGGRDVTWLEGRCLSYGENVPYLPILEMLRRNFGITEDVHGIEVADRVRPGLEAVGMDADEWAPYLAQILGTREGTERLVGLAPEAVRSRTLEAIRQLALHGSQRRPLVLVLEDLQWIDRTSEEVVNELVGGLAGAAIMFIATYRPGYRPQWMDKSYATQIAIQPLSQEDSRSVMRAALRAKEVSDVLARQILDKAEGNPFFLEELAGSVRDQTDLGPTLDAPDTVQDVLRARIHRLGDAPRQALQAAALFGRESSLRVLRSIWRGPDDIETSLRELVRLEFLYAHSRGAEPVYVFKHPLTQEVAYTSRSGPERQRLHAEAGHALENIYADRLPDAYEQLAHHYARSDRHDKAVEYLTLFARKAVGLHAHEEAVRVLEEAQRHLQGVPPSEREWRRLDLLLQQASELIRLGRLKEIVETLLPQREAVARIGDPALSAQYHFVLCHAYSFLDRERSVWHAERAIAEADRCGDDVVKGKAYSVLGQDGPLAGRASEGIAYGLKAVELLQDSEEHWWLGRAHWVVALNYCQIGAFDEASTAIAAAEAIAESTGQPPLQAVVAWCTGIIRAARGDADASVQACRRGIECVRDPLNRAITTGWLGYALMEKGEAGEAIARLDHVTRLLGQFGYRPLQAWFLAFLAEAHRLEGQLDVARDVARKSLQIAADAQVRVAEGWARLVLGRIAIDAGAHADAEAHLEAARAAFEAVHSRYELARTQMELAVATHALGKKAEAQTLLNIAHTLFEEINVPHHVRRAERLARDLGLSLSRK